jgi:hypothetical protein
MNGSGPGLFEAVIESWRLVIGNAAALARIALVPFLIFIALNRLKSAFEPEGMAILAWNLLFTILAAGPAVMLLMPWYRRLLAAADPAMKARPAMWWSVVLMLRWVGLDIMFFAGMAPVVAMSIQVVAAGGEPVPRLDIFAFYWTAIIMGSYLFYGRMGMALPAAAAESDHSYRRSWAMTQDSGWRIGFAGHGGSHAGDAISGRRARRPPPHRQRTPGHGGIRAILPGSGGRPCGGCRGLSARHSELTMTSANVLPVWATIGGTYRFAARHWWRLAFMGLPFLAVAIFLTLPTEPALLMGLFVIPEGEQPLIKPLSWSAYMLLELRWELIFTTATVFGLVAAHRLVLLNDCGPSAILPFRLGKREVRFLAVLLIVMAPGALYSAGFSILLRKNISGALGYTGDAAQGGEQIFQGAVVLVILLGSLFVSWLTLRLSLNLPATALDARSPFRTGWRLGRGNNWRLIAVATIAAAPAVLLLLGFEITDSILASWESATATRGDIMRYESRPAAWTYIMPIGEAITVWAMVALEAVMLSLCYRRMGGMDEAPPPAIAET